MKPLKLDYDAIVKSHGKDIADAMAELQSIFTDGLITWFANLWDDGTGAFYYSNSARDNEGFLPDIESTAQALGNLKGAGLVSSYDGFPFDMARRAAIFAKNLQDPSDGFFYHPQWGKEISTSRRGRDLNNALGIIRDGGETPLYVDANTRIREAMGKPDTENSVIPEHLRSREVFLEYLEGLGINGNSYSQGHKIGAQASQIAAAGLTDVCIDFLTAHQYENGLWEKELTYRASNGLMKISCAYRGLKRTMPRLKEAFDASLKIAMLDSRPGAITDVYNTFYTIENVMLALMETGDDGLIAYGKELLAECAPELIRMTKKKLEVFYKPDGSFSYAPYNSSITSQAALASLGCYEGDVNATVIAIGTRRRCCQLLGIDAESIYTAEDLDAFTRIIAENAARGPFPKYKPLTVERLDKIEEEWGREVSETVGSMHTVFTDGLYKWIAGMWDKESGGFYYSGSARDNEEFRPDIESTSQALCHIRMLGIVDDLAELPDGMKNKIIGFLQGLQDPGDGYFYHPQWGKEINTSRRGRDLGNAVRTLRALGAEPLYPTATERFEKMVSEENADKSAMPEHLRSEEAFRKYLLWLDLPSDAYGKGHILSSQAAEIKAAGLADICGEYLDSTQLENGLWTAEADYYAANALLKISSCYRSLGREFPNLQKALITAIGIALSTKPALCLVEVYNPICSVDNLIENVRMTGKTELLEAAREILQKNARLLIKVTKEKLAVFKKRDGSFSYNYNRSTPRSQGALVSLGLDEGDMNAVALADSSRARCLQILGIETGNLLTDEMKKEFFGLLGY